MLPIIARTIFRMQERMLGRESFRILAELNESQWWPRDRMDDLRLRRLQRLVCAAYEDSPFWRSLMDEHSIRPDEIRTLEDLQRFPLLTKIAIRENLEQMVSRRPDKRRQLVRTSGSTNEALQFYSSSLREAHINAGRMRGHEWIGVRRGDREMYFWGSPVELSKQDRIKRVRDWLINDGLTNGFKVTPERVAQYVEYWKRWRPKCIFGYPSSFTLLVTMAGSQGIDLTQLKDHGLEVISTTSEMLGKVNRKIISEGFDLPVYDSYGLREAGLIGHECAEQTMHCMDEQVILETIDPHTLEATDSEGELVVTNIMSATTPIIRYRTGDIVTLSDAPCACGRGLSSLTISGGRAADFVVTLEGTWVAGYAFIYICRSIKGVVKFQAQQDKLGEIHLRLVTDENFPADGEQQAITAAKARLGEAENIIVERVADIQPAPSGKYRPVIGNLAAEMSREMHAPVS